MLTTLRRDPAQLQLALMLALTFSTGIIDAVGYLGLDRVFTGNMTGNVVILGMAIVGADELHIAGPLVALFSFLLGAAVGGRVLRPVEVGWTARTTGLFAVVGLTMAALSVILILNGTPGQPYVLMVTGSLAAAMGIQAATARHLAVKDVTTVVVTSTLTGFAADSWLGAGRPQPWFRRLAAIVLIGAGAAVGAILLKVDLGAGLGLAAALTLATAVIGHLAIEPSPKD